MFLADRDIRLVLQRLENALIVDPGFDPARLQPASLELTLDPFILVEQPFDPSNPDAPPVLTEETIPAEGRLLWPGEFVLASTVERVHLPSDVLAQVNGKSSYARRGLVTHQTAGFIDPGFKGQITLELSNASLNPLRLTVGMPICQLVFGYTASPAERPYGSAGLGSHYQNQVGVTASRL